MKDIDLYSVVFQGARNIRGIIDGDTLILKFNRQDLQNVGPGEEVEFLLTGQLTDGTIFKGTDAIRVIY